MPQRLRTLWRHLVGSDAPRAAPFLTVVAVRSQRTH